jgi:hypothetical protein
MNKTCIYINLLTLWKWEMKIKDTNKKCDVDNFKAALAELGRFIKLAIKGLFFSPSISPLLF